MRCNRRPFALALALATFASLSPLQAVVLLLDPGADAGGANNTTVNTVGPYSTISTDRWNKGDNSATPVYGDAGVLVYSDGTAAVGVTAMSDGLSGTAYNFTSSPGVNSSGNAGAGGVFGNTSAGRDGYWASTQGVGYGGIATRVSGLAPGTYDVCVVAAYTGGTSTLRVGGSSAAQEAVWVFGGANTNTLTTGTGALDAGAMNENLENGTAAAWTLGNNYTVVQVTLDATNTDIYVVTEGSLNDGRRGWQNAIQIVSVPEPSVAGLAGLGFFGLFLRRRRR